MLALGPAVVGAFLLSLGCVYTLKRDRSIKALIAIALTAVFSFVSYWSLLAWWYAESFIRSLH